MEQDDSPDDFPVKIAMVEFEKQIFINIFQNDGLVICAKGLNYHAIVTNLLWVHNGPSNLVLVVNSSDWEEKYYTEQLQLRALPTTATERQKVYLEGGIYFISTRILVVDLLKNRIPIEHITGLLIMRAHSILESCQEAFALRLYRQKNKEGFIKAFSSSPICFTFGFGHVEKVMRSLFVKELYLWPRFHGTVIKCLKAREARVIELHVPMTPNMVQIQTCLLDIMNYTMKELKKMNRTLDFQEVTTENCITKKFHKILQSQLDSMWHQLSNRTKELINDLKVLRTLIIYLIHQDPISFYSLLSHYRTPEYAKTNSGWILLDSADQLFKLAKGRILNSKQEFDPESCPKWKILSEVLIKDIPEHLKENKCNNSSNVRILILCQDSKTCSQLNQYLTCGPEKFLFYTAFRNDIPVTSTSNKFKSLKKIELAKDLKKLSSIKESEHGDNKADDVQEDDDEDGDSCDKTNYVLTLTQNLENLSSQSLTANDSIFEPFSQMENMDITQIDTPRPIIYINTFKENGSNYALDLTLEYIKPQYIILYHADVAAIRQIEVFEARKKPDEPVVTIYFLIHSQTVEEQSYLTSLRREKQAFELLIQTKSKMVLPTYQDGKSDECFTIETDSLEIDTRKAGGQSAVKNVKPQVIVDIREFRSDLPALLHKKGIDIEPVTITIGDYILTPEICVERKSLSDLIGSLNSGRLYTQCTQMCRNYTRPILLIEFDQNRPFQLQGHFVISNDMTGSDIQQKLQLLTIHFPRLKLVWSPSPYATADLFYELKQNRENPSVEEAVALGGDMSGDDLTIEKYNHQIHDFIMKLPGVNFKNVARMMNRGISLENLISLTQAQIEEIIENKSDASTFYAILHNKYKASESTSSADKPKRKFTGKFNRGRK